MVHISFWFTRDHVNILGGNVYTIKSAEALVVDSKEIRLKVNTDKTK